MRVLTKERERVQGLRHNRAKKKIAGLVAQLVEARGKQPVDNAIVQDIDTAIDALVEFVES